MIFTRIPGNPILNRDRLLRNRLGGENFTPTSFSPLLRSLGGQTAGERPGGRRKNCVRAYNIGRWFGEGDIWRCFLGSGEQRLLALKSRMFLLWAIKHYGVGVTVARRIILKTHIVYVTASIQKPIGVIIIVRHLSTIRRPRFLTVLTRGNRW